MRYPGFIVCLVLLLFSFLASFSQAYNFRIFDQEKSDLENDFVYALEQDSNGLLFVGTGDGPRLFDGVSFYPLKGDSVPKSAVINTVYSVGEGEKIYLGTGDGRVYMYDNYSLEKLSTGFSIHSQVLDFTETADGYLLYLTQNNGIVRVDPEHNQYELLDAGLSDYRLSGFSYWKDSIVFLTTDQGLLSYNYRSGEIVPVDILPSVQFNAIESISAGNRYMLCSDRGHLFVLETAGDSLYASDLSAHLSPSGMNIQHAMLDTRGNIWLSTFGDGVCKIPFYQGDYQKAISITSEQGLPGDYIKQVFEDYEGNIWLATYGYGLVGVNTHVFSLVDTQDLKTQVTAMAFSDSLSIVALNKRLLIGASRSVSFPSRILSVEVDNMRVWVGTQKDGVFAYNLRDNKYQQVFLQGNSLANHINDMLFDEDQLYLATMNGIYILDMQYQPIAHISTNNNLFHNAVHFLLKRRGGDILAVTNSKGLYNITENEPIELTSFFNTDFVSLAEDSRGALWIATKGDGVLYYHKNEVIHYTVNDGLKSNYCYGVLVDQLDRVWVISREGLSTIHRTRRITSYGSADGIESDFVPNSFAQYESTLFFGTTEGYIAYETGLEASYKKPPRLSIRGIEINGKRYDSLSSIVLPYGQYDIKISYLGVHLKHPKSVLYSYHLQHYDSEWSELSYEPYAVFKKVSKGKYVFHVKAVTHEGKEVVLNQAVSIEIKKPFWEEIWFILLALLSVLLMIYLIIVIREKKQKQKEEMLKELLEERTHEVVKQKEEIELKNRDITDSINYAWRIQSGLMPSIDILKSSFADSFVFYKPKDIVSGDFYWFTELDNGNFFVACADCTGHGVPGSMVSMIGITLLKDICKRDVNASPAEKLFILDQEFEKTLNQNKRKEASNDGMDIIIAEFDKQRQTMTFASAMRPLWMYRKKEMFKYKGSNSSIGGYRFFEEEHKNFEDQVIQLQKEDVIYLFSDGLVDQFGGPNNKKYRPLRLWELLKRHGHYELLEQLIVLENDFNEWKGGYFQIDDVLVMALKV